jgi:hypothetical protein
LFSGKGSTYLGLESIDLLATMILNEEALSTTSHYLAQGPSEKVEKNG